MAGLKRKEADMLEEQFRAVRLHKLMGNPLRVKILRALHEAPRTPTRLARLANRPLPAISRALGILHADGLVDYRTVGPCVLYRLRHPEVLALLDMAEALVRRFNLPAPAPSQQAS
jgi:DNA-binding transcriptional ArsR family regulator